MVTQKPSMHGSRDMNEYQRRTLYGRQLNNYPQASSKNNRVPVANSSGCCCSSSKQSSNNSQRSTTLQSQTPQLTAHEKTHIRLDPSDPFYQRHGLTSKNQNRNKHSYQQPASRNKVHSTTQLTNKRQANKYPNYPVQTSTATTTKKQSSCTIL